MEEDFYKFYFIYRNDEIEIQCKANEKMGEILKRFASKVGEADNIESLVFLLSGNIVKEDLTVKEIIGKNIFNLKKILVYSNAPIQKPDVIKKSNNIICPECKEDIRLKINNFKIYLYDCKNGHQINDIFLNEFEKTQNINLSKIICDSCKENNKGESYNNEFYFCVTCKFNLCALCNNKHDKNHKIIEHKRKYYFCNEHNDSYIKYCKDCRENLCFSCIEKHKNHKIESYEDIIPDMKTINNEIQNMGKTINDLERNVEQIKNKFDFVLSNIKIYYNIYKEMIDNFEKDNIKNRKYEIFQNINGFKNNIANEINAINENIDYKIKIDKIIEIYEKMINKNIDKKDINNIDNPKKIITCEKCYSIPRITFLLGNKIKIECFQCKTSIIKDISFFDNYILSKNVSDIPQCSYDKNHKSSSVKYCYDCEKFLCNECIKEHNNTFEQAHIFLDQKIQSNIYCKKEGHNGYKFNKYCTICEQYICPKCKCEHESQYYYLNDPNVDKKVKKISEKILKSEEIIETEEKELNIFLEKINNRSETLKKMFENYKERNLKVISVYKLLIDNFNKIKYLNNFNLENNIILNDNFDFNLSSSEISLKFKYEDNVCLSSLYNKLCNFYLNKNYIITKYHPEYIITKKFCNRKIQKVICINDEKFIFIFEKGNSFFFLFKTEKNIFNFEEIRFNVIIKDIFLLQDQNFAFLSDGNNIGICKYNNNEYSKTFEISGICFFLGDLFNKSRFFIVENNSDTFAIKYFFEMEKKFYERNDKYGKFILYIKRKDSSAIKNMFIDINSIIENSSIKSKHKDKLKDLFKLPNNVVNKYELLLKIDFSLLEFIDYKTINYYNKLKDLKNKKDAIENEPNKDNVIINTNNVIFKLKSLSKIKGKYKEKLDYILSLYNLIKDIRAIYFDIIAINSKFNNGYNFNNNSIIFLVDKYPFIEFELKNNKFYSPITRNFLPNKDDVYRDFEIKHIFSNFIILNNYNKKGFYILVKKDDTYLIKGEFKYYSNIIPKNEYILYDVVNNNDLEFQMINLLNNSSDEYNYLQQMFKFRVSFNIPKITTLNNNKFLLLYENNQMCIIDFKSLFESNHNNSLDNNKNNSDNNIKEIKIKEVGPLKPKIMKHSDIYSNSYEPSNLFIEDDHYYCSSSNEPGHYIEFDFKKEYNFSCFILICYEKETRCRLKKYSMKLFDEKGRQTNLFEFTGKKENSFEKKYLGDKARYIRLDFLENFTGAYYIIKNIKFYAFDEIDDS